MSKCIKFLLFYYYYYYYRVKSKHAVRFQLCDTKKKCQVNFIKQYLLINHSHVKLNKKMKIKKFFFISLLKFKNVFINTISELVPWMISCVKNEHFANVFSKVKPKSWWTNERFELILRVSYLRDQWLLTDKVPVEKIEIIKRLIRKNYCALKVYYLTFFIWNLIVALTSSTFCIIGSWCDKRPGNLPALLSPGPKSLGICLIKASDARKASYFLAAND